MVAVLEIINNKIGVFNMDNELMQELTDLDVDNLIEKYKELQEEKDRLTLLEKQKIEQIKYNGEQIRAKINNN